MRTGVLLAVCAYTVWGLLPLYWRMLRHVSPLEILCHRVIWSFVFLAAVQTCIGNWGGIRDKLRVPGTRIMFIGTSCLICCNWLLYVWAVNSEYVVEASLGYFINPLLSVLLGIIILKERLRPFQWAAVALAAAGVLYLTFIYGVFPWISLLLALSFSLYGLLRKIGGLDAVEGLTFETGLLFVPTAALLMILSAGGEGGLGRLPVRTGVLLTLTGLVSSLPLIMFASAARRIPLSMVGILQYILPTMLFVLGVAVFREPFTRERLVGFALVWSALLVYTAEGILSRRPGDVRVKIAGCNTD